jgi:hypothetical protein
MKQLENAIAALTTHGDRLAAKRATAQDTLDKAIKSRQQVLLAGDDIDDARLAKLQVAVTDASSLLQGIDDAVSVLERQRRRPKARWPPNASALRALPRQISWTSRSPPLRRRCRSTLSSRAPLPTLCRRSVTSISSPARWRASSRTQWGRSKLLRTSRWQS